MRDLVVFLLFVGLLPMCMLRPWVGVVVFSFLAYNRTQDLTWGFARGLPIAQTVAIAMVVGWLAWEPRPLFRREARLKAMILLVVVVGISMVANNMPMALLGHRYQELVKVIFVALLTAALLNSHQRLRQIMLCICIGLGFYGFKNGLMWLLGSATIVGPGGMLKDNNDFALAMVMNVPLLWYISFDMDGLQRYGRYMKWGMRGVCATSFLTIMATGSRGGFLALACVLGWGAMKTKYKVPAIIAGLLIGALAWTFAPAEYTDRIKTIFAGAKDESAQGRLVSWAVATNMIKGNPVWGVGFNSFVWEYHNYTQGIELPPGYEDVVARVAHNSYFQIWAESGTIAYVTFMFIVLSSILLCRRTAKRARGSDDDWIVPYCNAIEVSLIGFLVGATFLNRAHFDLVYQMAAIVAAIPVVVGIERVRRGKRRPGIRPAQVITVSSGPELARASRP